MIKSTASILSKLLLPDGRSFSPTSKSESDNLTAMQRVPLAALQYLLNTTPLRVFWGQALNSISPGAWASRPKSQPISQAETSIPGSKTLRSILVSPSIYRFSILPLFLISFFLSGCSTHVKYLVQAAHGQFALANRARPISEVILDERTPLRIRNLLKEIEPVKKFGEANGLKPTANYTEYVKLDGDAAIWVVSACEKLKFKSKEWQFPFFGAFPFLGWFDKQSALDFAQELKAEDWDVDIRGAQAYSTLGWFRDSVLSTMIPAGDGVFGSLVNVVLHESVHATLYLKSQSFFNESLASFVADQMTLQYLDKKLGPNSEEKKAYQELEALSEVRRKRLHEGYNRLKDLYASQKTDEEKTKEKAQVLKELQEELKFKRPINNATLIQFKTYTSGKEEFERIYQQNGRDWFRFLKKLQTLKLESFGKNQQEDLGSVLKMLQN